MGAILAPTRPRGGKRSKRDATLRYVVEIGQAVRTWESG